MDVQIPAHPLYNALLLLLSLLAILTSAADPPPHPSHPSPRITTNLFYHSFSPSTKPQTGYPDPSSFAPLATLTFSPSAPHKARIQSLTPPPNTTEYTSIALFDDQGRGDKQNYRSTVTVTRGFHAPFKGRFRLLLSADGKNVLGASYKSIYPTPNASPPPAQGANKKNGKGDGGDNNVGDFDIAFEARAPTIRLDKAARKGGKSIGIAMPESEGEDGEQVEEKTFFQKYWWVIIGALAFTLIAPGDK